MTIAADLGDAPVAYAGLFVRELPHPQTDEPTGLLEVRLSGHATLVIEGRGQQFDAARQRLSAAVQKASPRTVSSRQPTSSRVSSSGASAAAAL